VNKEGNQPFKEKNTRCEKDGIGKRVSIPYRSNDVRSEVRKIEGKRGEIFKKRNKIHGGERGYTSYGNPITRLLTIHRNQDEVD